MRCLILGGSGQVGAHLSAKIPDAVSLTRPQIDFRQPATLAKEIKAIAPEFIINCAAYTAVDNAETDPFTAWQVNANGPSAISEAANTLGARVIHLSTDYVFDGTADAPYDTTADVNPQSVYGKSKLAGELAIQTIAQQHWIIRTSWVFSEHGQNFVKTMLRLGKEHESINVVDDQIGTPTYAGDIARVIALMITHAATIESGLFNVTGGKSVSWFQFAEQIFDSAVQLDASYKRPELNRISTEEYPTPAKRPKYSVLQPSQPLLDELKFAPNWEVILRKVVANCPAV